MKLSLNVRLLLPYLENLGSNSRANMTVANSKAVAPLAFVQILPFLLRFFIVKGCKCVVIVDVNAVNNVK